MELCYSLESNYILKYVIWKLKNNQYLELLVSRNSILKLNSEFSSNICLIAPLNSYIIPQLPRDFRLHYVITQLNKRSYIEIFPFPISEPSESFQIPSDNSIINNSPSSLSERRNITSLSDTPKRENYCRAHIVWRSWIFRGDFNVIFVHFFMIKWI